MVDKLKWAECSVPLKFPQNMQERPVYFSARARWKIDEWKRRLGVSIPTPTNAIQALQEASMLHLAAYRRRLIVGIFGRDGDIRHSCPDYTPKLCDSATIRLDQGITLPNR